MEEDAGCKVLKYPETLEIYKIQLNKFLGENEEWATIDGCPYFYVNDNIEEVKSHVRIQEIIILQSGDWRK